MRGKHGGFPDLPFFAFPIAEKYIYMIIPLIEPASHGNANTERQTLSQRARRHFHSRCQRSISVSLKPATQLSQGGQFFHREVAAFSQGGIEDGSGMSLAQDKPVAVRPLRILGAMTHDFEVKSSDDVSGRKRAAGMAAARCSYHGNDMAAQLLCHLLQLGGRQVEFSFCS